MLNKWLLTTSLLILAYNAYSQEGLTDWTFKSQRASLEPRHWVEETILYAGEPTLAISGIKEGHDNGAWVKRSKIEGDTFLDFSVAYKLHQINEPQRSVLATIVWLDEQGNQLGPKEFPARVDQQNGDWLMMRQIYRVPKGAHFTEVELIYRWDEDGTVYFATPKVKTVQNIPRRMVKLATVHHRPKGSTTEKNLLAFGKYVEEAGRKGADIVCLPEGMTLVGTGKNYVEAAESVPGPTSRFLGDIAKRHKLYIVAGILEKEGDIVYNTAIFLDREGNLAGKYRKVCLPREEIEGGVTPGQEFPVFETDFGKIGIMICWDVAFPEPARALAMQGADIILLPIWGGNLTLAKARSIENQVYLVSSTYDEDSMRTGVFDLEGNLIARATEQDPVAVVEVDLNQQKLWPWLGEFKNRIPQEMPSWNTLQKSR